MLYLYLFDVESLLWSRWRPICFTRSRCQLADAFVVQTGPCMFAIGGGYGLPRADLELSPEDLAARKEYKEQSRRIMELAQLMVPTRDLEIPDNDRF